MKHITYNDLIRFQKDLQIQFSKVLEEEEFLWFQKLRENGVKFGNKNTKFYHTQTMIRIRRIKVTRVNINGVMCDDEVVLSKEAKRIFNHLDCIPKITQELYDWLLKQVSMKDVKDSLFAILTIIKLLAQMAFNQFF